MTDAEKEFYAKLTENGGPAFPCDSEHLTAFGMTLLDYFAAAALTGIIAKGEHEGATEQRAKEAYALADAMLKERVTWQD